jgi:hypothetical protein
VPDHGAVLAVGIDEDGFESGNGGGKGELAEDIG